MRGNGALGASSDRVAPACGETTFHFQLRHVIEVIEGRAEPLTGGDDAIGNMRAIDAVYRAAGMRPRGLPA
jgi:predicted dehydrogenase